MTPNDSRWPLTLALCGGYFLVLLDVTVVNVALPQIGAELHAESTGLAWTVDAYSVPLAALLLASGAIGDLIGHRRVVLLGMVGFGAASVLCALATTIGVLVVARAVQGIGAALMLPGTLALLVDNNPDETSRNRLVGVWAAIGGAALPAGPVIGGLLVQAAGWRAVFWLSVPVIALALVPVVQLRRSHPQQGSERKVDWIGAALLVIALTCLVTAIIQAPASLVLAAALAAAAVFALLGFLAVERRGRNPLLPVPREARHSLGLASLVAGLMNLCALGGLFLLTQVFQDVHGLEPLAAGLLTLPAMLPLPLLGAPAGRLANRLGVWRTAALGLVVAAAGMAGIAATLTNTGISYVALAFFLALWGTGLGVLTPAIVSAALKATPCAPGLASGASNTARQTGGALGIAIFAAVAGAVTSPGFSSQSAALFIGAAVVFVLAGLLCFGIAVSQCARLS
ncbi:MFS transporter, DHA2 family, methylenomycin A resistance protein [Streptomyces melanosporofaciens]|uniref:MFS transporter, DHA2 family, methylenomycin A resistance protein n=2 Tax=Streptomyces melanosporofaciens TaxID=67327 RepID=A0A1H4IAF5_STRMJ|nr:MFS transporter [Streptomyces melanosporofaciens]SEB30981.1 MFS transporter, DHA2 family, methylenomycin A resistance protein [Streptomyces melanosporofaciens]